MKQHDLVVVGDGPAGSALAWAATRLGADVALIGPDDPWANTYGVWIDDLAAAAVVANVEDLLATTCPTVNVWTDRPHRLERPYGVVNNDALRTALRNGVHHVAGRVVAVGGTRSTRVELADGSVVEAGLVVDAGGWPSSFAPDSVAAGDPAWQTAYGVVLSDPPDGDLGSPTLMDFRSVDADPVVTFAYSLPRGDGWLVEETVLAARPPVAPDSLRRRLARRLGTDEATLDSLARDVERVTIPMGGQRPRRGQDVVAFGAAAGYVNPISGYSLTASLTAAPIVARAFCDALAHARSGPVDRDVVWDAVWSTSRRRTRELHDYGFDMLLRFDAQQARDFFGTFFDLPTPQWSAFLRSETPPVELARVMLSVFNRSSWATRRDLVRGDPRALLRLARPR